MNIHLRHALFVSVAILLLAAGCNRVTNPDNNEPEVVACTMEARQCPDGSYVGRQGPSCEFAACPATPVAPTPAPGGKTTPPGQNSSGIEGEVVMGPTCPVERFPQEPGCGEQPYQATVRIKTLDGKKVVAEFTSDKDGKFKVALAPGTYLVDPEVGRVYPRASTQEVVVVKNVFTHITIQYDSGIR